MFSRPAPLRCAPMRGEDGLLWLIGVRASGNSTHIAADGDGAAGAGGIAIFALADATGSVHALSGGHAGHTAGNGDIAATAIVVSTTDAGTISSASCCDCAAGNVDIAAFATLSATDAGTTLSALCCDCATADGDIAAGVSTSADAGTTKFTSCCDCAVLDNNIAARISISAAYTGTIAVAAGVERAGAFDGERLASGHMDAWITYMKSLHSIRTAENDGCVALAGDASPLVVIAVVHAIDGDVIECHHCTVGDGNLHVRGQRAGEDFAVAGSIVCIDC